MIRIIRCFLVVACAVLAIASDAALAATGKRIALVIGNSEYSKIGQLRNPSADGRLMADTLKSLDFETTLLVDAQQLDMKRAIAAFGRQLRTSGRETVGLFYYAGHGIQAGGRNYLMPIEANPQDEADLDLVGVEANWVLRQMESAGNLSNIIILDACRNNPLGAKARSATRGLARIDAPTGSFISYSTAPGTAAIDGDGANSPFTTALAEALKSPERPIEQIFKEVRKTVIQATNGRQTPWDSSSLVQDFYFSNPTPVAAIPAAATPPPPAAATPVELSLWQSVSKSGDPGRLALFLQLFPKSGFAPDARNLLMQTLADNSFKNDRPREVAPAQPAPDATMPSEHEMIAQAQTSNQLADYAAYLSAYPNGVFADLAKAEIEHLVKLSAPARQTPDTAAAAPKAPPAQASPKGGDDAFAALTFDRPIPVEAASWANGLSLRDMARASPEYPPIEGLDDSVWQGQKCSNCHNWSIGNLCDQGKFYVKAGNEMLSRKRHPYGGEFKKALASWAKGGCR